jgi:hypothetical protein
MKTLIQENGFEYSHNHRFGDPKSSLNEFQFLLSYVIETGIEDFTEKVSYRITEDNYIQLCRLTDNYNDHSIVAQQLKTNENLKIQFQKILRDYFVGLLLFFGYPYKHIDSIAFDENEFKSIVLAAEEEYDRLKNCKLKSHN